MAERTSLTSLNNDDGASLISSRSRRDRSVSVARTNEVQATSQSCAWSSDVETSSRTVALSRPWSSAFAVAASSRDSHIE